MANDDTGGGPATTGEAGTLAGMLAHIGGCAQCMGHWPPYGALALEPGEDGHVRFLVAAPGASRVRVLDYTERFGLSRTAIVRADGDQGRAARAAALDGPGLRPPGAGPSPEPAKLAYTPQASRSYLIPEEVRAFGFDRLSRRFNLSAITRLALSMKYSALRDFFWTFPTASTNTSRSRETLAHHHRLPSELRLW